MKYVALDDETKELMDRYMPTIKGEYVTQKLFLDSAIRSRLRHLGAEAGQDLIIAHLERLEASNNRQLDRQSIAQTKLRHKRRVEMATKRLNGEM